MFSRPRVMHSILRQKGPDFLLYILQYCVGSRLCINKYVRKGTVLEEALELATLFCLSLVSHSHISTKTLIDWLFRIMKLKLILYLLIPILHLFQQNIIYCYHKQLSCHCFHFDQIVKEVQTDAPYTRFVKYWFSQIKRNYKKDTEIFIFFRAIT